LAHLGARRRGRRREVNPEDRRFLKDIQALARMFLIDLCIAGRFTCAGAAVGIPHRAVAG
jgi:hypothetical protein